MSPIPKRNTPLSRSHHALDVELPDAVTRKEVAHSSGGDVVDITAAPGTNGHRTHEISDLSLVWEPTTHWPSVPRRARPPWGRPDVLVLGEDLPNFLRGEPGFHPLTHSGLEDLLASLHGPAAPANRPIVAVPHSFRCSPEQLHALRVLEDAEIPVVPLATVVEKRCRLHILDDALVPQHKQARVTAIAHRALDLICGAVGTALFLALLPFVALAILIEDGGPIFYSQDRVGRSDKPFRLFKFRSMRSDAEPYGPTWSTVGDDRTTKVGSFLRRYKIDELPQCLNVLLGHMSMVGPRPERPFFVEVLKRHVPHYEYRHRVRPGITGWGTVNVGYGNSIEAKYLTHQFDLYHMCNRSLRFDIEIMARSIRALVAGPDNLDRYML